MVFLGVPISIIFTVISLAESAEVHSPLTAIKKALAHR